jgi:proline iminopeptidase
LIGQSWGGILATLYAAEHPDKLEKIIFTCPGPIQPQRRELSERLPPDSLHLRKPDFLNARGNREARNIRSNMMSYLAVAFGYKLASDAEADDFNTYLGGKLNRSLVCDNSKTPPATPGAGYYVSVMTVSKFNGIKDPRPGLRQVKCPVLVMKGQCDSIDWGYTQEYLELFTQHKLVVIPDAGHSIGIEQPKLYFSSIRDFLLHGQEG